MKKYRLKYINLDRYEALESFIKKDSVYNRLLKTNLALKHHNIKVEFLRYFIV